jgi:hypothetical protein
VITYYIVDDAGQVIPEADLYKWADWFETTDRCLAHTEVGPAQISTVFLGIDHRLLGDGPPILWETLIYWPNSDMHGDMQRYVTRDEALAGHALTVELVRRAQRRQD